MYPKIIKADLSTFLKVVIICTCLLLCVPVIIFFSTYNIQNTLTSTISVLITSLVIFLPFFLYFKSLSLEMASNEVVFVTDLLLKRFERKILYADIQEIDSYYFNREDLVVIILKDKQRIKFNLHTYSAKDLKILVDEIKSKNENVKIEANILEYINDTKI